MPSLAFTASTIFRQMSFEKPMGSLELPSLYEKGIELSRLPIWIAPLALILLSVSESWAAALEARRAVPRAMARCRRKFMGIFRSGVGLGRPNSESA